MTQLSNVSQLVISKSVAAAMLGASALALLAATPASAQQGKIPEFGSNQYAWLITVPLWQEPGGGLRGPIMPDPEQKKHDNQDGPGQVTPRMGNWRDPVLKPWAQEMMRKSNEEVISGKRVLPFAAQASCYPGGVPGQLLYPAEPFYFIQTPKIVYMIWQRDHMVRRIFMTDKHSETVKHSWFGESIGRYEGNELVVDTVGLLSSKNALTFIDNYRTPHTEKLHVVERYKVDPDGRNLQVDVKVTDPDTFNEPMNLRQRWRRVANELLETVCAENNDDKFGHNLFPMPEAKKFDF